MKNAIEIKNVVKKYDDKFTLGPIDLEIPSGEIIGLIGENGAGKTTLIKSILGITSVTGDIKIFEKSYDKEEETIRKDIGVVLDNAFFPEVMNSEDIAEVLKSVYDNFDDKLYHDYLKKFDIPPKKSLKKMSKGMRKKVEIASALAHNPKLLILDEPTAGLDPVVRNEILDIFMKFIEDDAHTILFSTHITSELEHIADQIVFIDNGEVILQDSRDAIMDEYGILKCKLESFDSIDKKDIVSFKKNRYGYDILIKNKKELSKKYKDFIVDKITLEDLMILMIKGEKDA